MTSEICDNCAKNSGNIYQCGKCGVHLCLHTVRMHTCKTGRQKRRRPSISLEAWERHLKRVKRFEVQIQPDWTIFVDFPWFPFTLLKAWVPTRRSNYKNELNIHLNLEELFVNLEKETKPHQYERKFYYKPWIQENFTSWQLKWKRAVREYWTRRSNQRPTKFMLQFPQFAEEDIELLKKHGCKIIFEPGDRKPLKKLIADSLQEFALTVRNFDGKIRVNWSNSFNKWFHSYLNNFLQFMAIRSEDDPEAEAIPCITQIQPQEIEVAYWATFRANYFWKILNQVLREMSPPPFHLKYEPLKLPTKKWSFPIKPDYTLRAYQRQAIKNWKTNSFFGTCQLPTGAGKTIIGLSAIQETQERTLILVPNLALVDQWQTQISNRLGIPIKKIGIFNGQKKEFRNHFVVVSTYQLLSQYLQDFEDYQNGEPGEEKKIQRKKDLVEDTIGFFTDSFGLIITDEAHHIQAETFRKIGMNLKIPKRLSLSATIEKSNHSSLVIGIMGPIVFDVTYGSLSKEGFIAPIYFHRFLVPFTEKEIEFYKSKKDTSRIEGKLTREARNKYLALLKIVQSPFTGQTLIYTTRINHANRIHKFLKENEIESTLLTEETASTDIKLTKILDDFKQGQIRILILVKMLNEGFDAPADTVIVVSGTRNRREQIQRFGRATRPAPNKIAKLFELVVDPKDLYYEFEVAEERDVADIIQPWIQEDLISSSVKEDMKALIRDIEMSYQN
ncbi:MAG: DEAD/DEAH box helicase [Promethearchaeota archaeon]